jgi:hypothetical protein
MPKAQLAMPTGARNVDFGDVIVETWCIIVFYPTLIGVSFSSSTSILQLLFLLVSHSLNSISLRPIPRQSLPKPCP